ncbi:MAG: Ubiquitin fusion degradation protein 4 [Phylliscum demangeonii]|nr:MAG: Ubiquitin fusion degradation protein 4 [Phylliscum demangeonii]
MANRVTRSSTRQAAEAAKSAGDPLASAALPPPAPHPPTARKRGAPTAGQEGAELSSEAKPSPPRRPKRQKVVIPSQNAPGPPFVLASGPSTRRGKAREQAAMSASAAEAGAANEPPTSISAAPTKPSRRKSDRAQKDAPILSRPGPRSSRSKKAPTARDDDATMADPGARHGRPAPDDEDDLAGEHGREEEEDDDDMLDHDGEVDDDDDVDPFTSGYLAASGHPLGISSTLRALSGMISGVQSRLRDILANMKQKGDPSVQLIALQELSEILLVSTEDNLAGHFAPDPFVKELVALMEPDALGGENPEIMLLACRSIANLMEALPSSVANVVYGGAVPILCQKLLEIHFIDLAEQALSTLEKISVEFPTSIVREGGLTACLTYLDFFATSTQRTAVTTAANCCRNIPEDSFPVVRDVMPILLNVLASSDQKVVEQACLCVCRVVESFRFRADRLEELVSTDLLRAIIRLLLPGTTTLIGQHIHTQFLRVLAIIARASPKLSAELFKMNVVDTLYQILTGVSPPADLADVASEIDSVVVMQALIHRTRDQVFETLNVICELLPALPADTGSFLVMFSAACNLSSGPPVVSSPEKRLELLADCRHELKRFAVILLPTLTDAYSSTVNLSVRQKVLHAQLKMVSNLDSSILEDALRSVPYASFLAAILSQEDHPTLVVAALQAAELLIRRLDHIYRYQFYREGVIAEITKLAQRPIPANAEDGGDAIGDEPGSGPVKGPKDVGTHPVADHDPDDDSLHSSDDDDDEPHDLPDDYSGSPTSSRGSSASHRNRPVGVQVRGIEQYIVTRAKKFLEVYESAENGRGPRERAAKILHDLRSLAAEMESHYLGDGHGDAPDLFPRLAGYFVGDALDSITSYELLHSGIVGVLLTIFSDPNVKLREEACAAFLEAFTGTAPRPGESSTAKASPTPFGALVHTLQDLLSRAEHFEVLTIQSNAFDGSQANATSMLAKQLRLKLVADDSSGIPRPFRNVMVSIHAIATFKALDDYLRPRISMSERPKNSKHRDGVSHALAAFAAAAGLPNPHPRLLERGAPPVSASSTLPVPSAATTRVLRKSTKSKSTTTASGNPPHATAAPEKPAATRRSSRKHPAKDAPVPGTAGEASSTSRLECADEKRVLSQTPEKLDDSGALDAILGELNDAMADDASVEPSAVNMEVASSGKVTARKEDGTHITTPSHATASSSPDSVTQPPTLADVAGLPLGSLGRHRSYAAAMQSIPQDWHLEFSVGGEAIKNEMTIYRAVGHRQPRPSEETPLRSVWSTIHPINFKRVSGPPPSEPATLSPTPDASAPKISVDLPDSLEKNHVTSTILRLLNILHALNAHMDDVLGETRAGEPYPRESLSQFVNTKLTAKLNRQLEEPLIVASHCLPQWSEDLARLYPFLFPFETRHLFLQSTSFGYARSTARWQTAPTNRESRQDRLRDDRPFLGRLQRQKVRISRNRILESAIKVMELYGASPSILEVEYFEEVGTGLGPTLEFYSTVSKEFSKKKLKLWRETESSGAHDYAFGRRGLFPAPMSDEQAETEAGKRVLHLFKVLGKFVARSMLDSRIIDVSFNPTFFRIGDGPATVPPSLGALRAVDEDLANSLTLLKQFANAKAKIDEDRRLTAEQRAHATGAVQVHGAQIEDLGLDFTLPGYPSIELHADGSNTPVTMDNVGAYVDGVIALTLGDGVQKQIDAFRAGFSSVFPYTALKAFTPDELVMLFGRVEEDWSLETLMDSIKADHGFNMDSRTVKNLLHTMSELTASDRRQFLQFVTGSPKLPIGGFKRLTPMFTVVCRPSEPPYTSDDYLPSVMTCVNYLKLPDYTTLEIMRQRLHLAIRDGQGAFHLS